MTKIEEILQEARPVSVRRSMELPVTNGIVENHLLDFHKKRVLDFGLTYLKEGIVKIKQHFPRDEHSRVDLNLDIYILEGKHYRKIMELIDKQYG